MLSSDSESGENDPCASSSASDSSDDGNGNTLSTTCICGGSASDSDSSDDVMFAAGVNMKGMDQGLDGLMGNKAENSDEEGYDLNVTFTTSTYLNVWGIFALMLLLNGMCCFMCYKQKKVKRLRAVVDDDFEPSSRMEIVA